MKSRNNSSLIGLEIDGYRIEALLGHGGMAQVYRGFDLQLHRHVALKVILPEQRDNVAYEDRFRKEARAVASLKHPGIVSVYRFGHVEGLYYLAMDYINGPDLNWILKAYRNSNATIPVRQSLHLITQIADALDHAHKKGVIHRDVKPSNIMLDSDGNAILTDFGLALMTSEGTLGGTFGSPHYIAPEQAVSSANVVPQSDLYALGVIVYEMLTGNVPFQSGTAMQIAMAHISDAPPPLRAYRATIHPAYEQVLAKALSKKPEERYPNGAKLAQALRGAFRLAQKEKQRTAPMQQIPKIIDQVKSYQAEYALLQPDTASVTLATRLGEPQPNPKPRNNLRFILLTAIALTLLLGAGLRFGEQNVFGLLDTGATVTTPNLVIEGPVSVVTETQITIFDVILFLENTNNQAINIQVGDYVRLTARYIHGDEGEIIVEKLISLTVIE